MGAAGPGRRALGPDALTDATLRLLGKPAAGCGRPVPGLPAGPAQPAPTCGALSGGAVRLWPTLTGSGCLSARTPLARLFAPHGRVGAHFVSGLGFSSAPCFRRVSVRTQRGGQAFYGRGERRRRGDGSRRDEGVLTRGDRSPAAGLILPGIPRLPFDHLLAAD